MSYPNGRFSPPDAPRHGTAAYGTQPWRRETVQAFFEGFAWGGGRLGAGFSQTPGLEQKLAPLIHLITPSIKNNKFF
ncbi:MAG: hypothetical protein HC922_03315 [Leptolyngbyaceae cyanobacterium SM2_3_12]|nr:hypothetical protein [Leptolyngbyaceae cyanobacterium SM2_3_12]